MKIPRGRAAAAVFGRHGYVAAWLAVVLLKLWLTSHIRIIPAEAPHDASNFLEHAVTLLQGRWFGAYDDMTLIKGPAFPLYMAAVQETGVPLPLAHQLLYALAALIACVAVRPLVRGRLASFTVFTVVLFDPFTFATLAWVTYRSQLTESLALIAVACAAAMWLRRDRSVRRLLPWSAALSVTVAVFWLTREESVWLVPGLAVLLAAFGWDAVRRRRRALWRRLALVALPVVAVVLAVQAVSAVNLREYGWYTAVEMQSPEFVSAYNSLARIDVPRRDFIPVPRAALRLAYAVSPAAHELQRGFEGGRGPGWMRETCNFGLPCDEIGGGWFMWALRDAVQTAGHYWSGADARAFYVRLAREVDAACDARALPCRPKARTLVPPIAGADLPALLANALKGARIAATFAPFTTDHWPLVARNAELERDYLFVTRAVETTPPGQAFEGWLVHPALRSIGVAGPAGADAGATITFKPSPDVEQALRGAPAIRGDTALARFTIETQCTTDCVLDVAERGGRSVRIPLAMTTRDFRSGDAIVFHLDDARSSSARRDFDERDKVAALRAIGTLYQAVVPYALAFALVTVLFRGARALRRRSLAGLREAIVVVAVLASAAALLAILTIIDTFSFPSFNAEYLGGVFPLLLFACAVAAAGEAAVIRRVARRADASRARTLALGGVMAAATFAVGLFLQAAPEAPAQPAAASLPPRAAHAFSCARALTPATSVARGAVDVVGTRSAPRAARATFAARDALVVSGWAADAAGEHPLAGVCLVLDGRTVANESVRYGSARPDVAAALKQPDVADTGYEITLEPGQLRAGTHSVGVVGVDAAGREEAVAPPRRIVVRRK